MASLLVINVVVWVGLAVVCGLAAHSRGYSALAAFLASLILTPLVVLLVLLLLPRRDRSIAGSERQPHGSSLDDRAIQAIAEAHRAAGTKAQTI